MKTELIAAIAENDLTTVKKLCNQENVNDPVNEKNYTALHCAAYANKPDIVSYLLSIPGCNINARCNNKNTTPVFFAAIAGHETMVTLLIRKGAEIDPNLLNNFSKFLEEKFPNILTILKNPENAKQTTHSWWFRITSLFDNSSTQKNQEMKKMK